MDCQTCRESVSARLDGEREPVPAADVDAHLRTCESCRAWESGAADLTRSLRVRAVEPVPDLTAAIVERAPPPVDTRAGWPRLALGGVAVAQLTLGMSQLFGPRGTVGHADHAGHLGGAQPLAGHLFNESTAWNLAIGVGLFFAAFRPRIATGVLPVLAGFVVVLLGFSTHDLIAGVAPLSRVAGHGLLVAGLVLLFVVHRAHREPAPPGAAARPADRGWDTVRQPPEAGSSPRRRGEGGPPLRPAGRRGAA